MSLIKSISGIRGTIGGSVGDGLTPPDVMSFVIAYGGWLKEQGPPISDDGYTVVVGRDARMSGPMVNALVCGTLQAIGINIIQAGMATTPTVEMCVPFQKADGGIILTASHNPREWNAMKLLNSRGEFLSAADGDRILELAGNLDVGFADIDHIGSIKEFCFLDTHIRDIFDLPLVDQDLVRSKQYRVVFDGVNSIGGIAIPALLAALGMGHVELINCEPTGEFAHNPEPLPEHLSHLIAKVKEEKADLGIVVDPDVDRLAFVCEDGTLFGEEYTLVAIADYVLSHTPGNTVSNLSSTKALRDITEKHGMTYSASAVGEVNVVELMKKTNAVIGGEGNGGIIYPELHYGRDALLGIALFLSYMARSGKSCRQIRDSYPRYEMSKNKIQLSERVHPDKVLDILSQKYSGENINTIDGLKIDFADSWVHMRKSNTEPIIRIYSEAPSKQKADELANKMISEISAII